MPAWRPRSSGARMPVARQLGFAPAGDFLTMHRGAYRVLVDKTGILHEVTFVGEPLSAAEQLETVRYLVYSFWHDVSHFTTAMARGQLWWAYGQIDVLRKMCVVYRERAVVLCRAHRIEYPDQLERIMARRLNALP